MNQLTEERIAAVAAEACGFGWALCGLAAGMRRAGLAFTKAVK